MVTAERQRSAVVPEQSGTRELGRDQRGRIWARELTQRPVFSVLYGETPPLQVLTAAGREFLQPVDRHQRRQLLQAALNQQLSGETLVVRGTEGKITRVTDAPYSPRSWVELLRDAVHRQPQPTQPSQLQAVEKVFIDRGSLWGWEMAVILDELYHRTQKLPDYAHQLLGQPGIQTIKVLGASHRSLYTEYIDGIELESFWFSLLGHDEELARELIPPLHDYSYHVRLVLMELMSELLSQYNYQELNHPGFRWQFRTGYTHFARRQAEQTTRLDVFVDVHPLDRDPVDRYRNWMLPAGAADAGREVVLSQQTNSAKVQLLLQLIKEQAIIFDPLYIRQQTQRPHRWWPRQKK